MRQFLECPIQSLRFTRIVLGSSYNEEDTNDADHHTQSSVPQPADGNDPLLHPGTQRCQMELRLKPGGICRVEQVASDTKSNKSNDDHQGGTKGLFEKEGRSILGGSI
jgi:hypothetical protein